MASAVDRRRAAVLIVTILVWLVGALVLWSVIAGQVRAYGREPSPGVQVSAGLWAPVGLAIPTGLLAGWALRLPSSGWFLGLLSSTVTVAGTVLYTAFWVSLRFVGDESPVEDYVIEFAWYAYGLAAILHATGFVVVAVGQVIRRRDAATSSRSTSVGGR